MGVEARASRPRVSLETQAGISAELAAAKLDAGGFALFEKFFIHLTKRQV
jgi:hypothetical protein